MRAVLAAAADGLELHHLVELIVAVGVAQPIQAAARPAVDRDVQAVEGVAASPGPP